MEEEKKLESESVLETPATLPNESTEIYDNIQKLNNKLDALSKKYNLEEEKAPFIEAIGITPLANDEGDSTQNEESDSSIVTENEIKMPTVDSVDETLVDDNKDKDINKANKDHFVVIVLLSIILIILLVLVVVFSNSL